MKNQIFMKHIRIIITVIFALSLVSSNSFAQEKKGQAEPSFSKNFVYFSMSDVVLKRLSFQYERMVGATRFISITIPFSYSFGDPNAVYKSLIYSEFQNFNFRNMVDFTDWYIGLGANLYPAGHNKVCLNVGPEIRLGPAHRYPDVYYYDTYLVNSNNEEITNPMYDEQKYLQTTFLLNIGGFYQPTPNFIVALNLGAGISSSIYDTVALAVFPTFRMGFSF